MAAQHFFKMPSGIFWECPSRAANPSRLHDSNAPRLERESLEKAAARAVVYERASLKRPQRDSIAPLKDRRDRKA
jgi:hypothetical protein